ncbi:MAG: M61 family metallopeptidase [Bacteriovoracaceae bacterium]|nr:M61 family metallopeptidase [Bacteriovoracaceae bacterium]
MMKLKYRLEIKNPENHIVDITIWGERTQNEDSLTFFLPVWSPGSYLVREYSRHIRSFRATNAVGEFYYFEQSSKNTWTIDWKKSEFKRESADFCIHYEVYCHEISVRTSFVSSQHAFLNGPSLFMGVQDKTMEDIELEIKFPALWSKVSTSLKDISTEREVFLYSAKNYDEFIDTPIEIGCHETDGFMVDKKPHHLAFYGGVYPNSRNLKQDIQKVVEYISKVMGGTPYEQYQFITHFLPNQYGGLEHHNSCVLHYDGRRLESRKEYLQWISLVAHEYFHTWNIKRIRPKELGPFDYNNENYTSMLWLAEGLTNFVDDFFIYASGLSTLEEYVEIVKDNLVRYLGTPGRKFHSLEASSFNAWIKLYRPDENSNNSSVSYYLKGGLVFSILHIELVQKKLGIKDFIMALWDRYLANPKVGVTTEEVLAIIKKLAGSETAEFFQHMLVTTDEIDFEKYYKKIGLKFIWEQPNTPYLGANFDHQGDRVFIQSVKLDSPAHKSGLNAGDEILAINGLRFLKKDSSDLEKVLLVNKPYQFLISRLGEIISQEVILTETPKRLKALEIADRKQVEAAFKI